MLMFLLRHLNPALFAADGEATARGTAIAQAQQHFAPSMAALVDTDVTDLLDINDYRPQPPCKKQA